MSVKEYAVPATLDEARKRRTELALRLTEIQSQLSQKDRDIEGVRMSAHEYHEWRGRAVCAVKHSQNEIIFLNAWIADNQPKRIARADAGESEEPIDIHSEFRIIKESLARIYEAFRDRQPPSTENPQ